MYKLANIYKSYDNNKTFILNDVSLNINKGDFIAIRGKSGSGKTTLLNILSTIDRPTSGYYTFENINLENLASNKLAEFRNKHIGIVFQEYNLISNYTVEENILLPTLFNKNNKNPDLDKITNILGVSKLLNKKTINLSGGERQRVAIARAIINNPNIIFADEPTGNLDKENSNILFDYLKKLNDMGVTILVVSHNEEFSNRFKRILEIKEGTLHEL